VLRLPNRIKPLIWLLPAIVVAEIVLLFAVPRVLRHPPAQSAATLSADWIPNSPVPAPDFQLADQNGRTMSLADLRGRVVALTFLNSHCTQYCPIIADQLGRIQHDLGPNTKMVLLVVSVAPAADTSASVRQFAVAHGWTGEWHWLMGSQDQLAQIWKAYDIGVQPLPSDIAHSIVLYLLDRRGYEQGAFAFGITPATLEKDVRLLSGG
jgi:protein SCO1/2